MTHNEMSLKVICQWIYQFSCCEIWATLITESRICHP